MLAPLLLGLFLAQAQPEPLVVDEIDSASLGQVVDGIRQQVALGATEVSLEINSYGGSVFDGMNFIKTVERIKRESGVKLKCTVDFKAMSMGFVILEAICDQRLMTKRSILMAHNSSNEAKGKALSLMEQLSWTLAIDQVLAEMCAARLKMSVDAYRAKVAQIDWVFTWQEALKVGAVDKVL